MSKLKHLLAVFAAVAIILSSQVAQASHFRYGNITYTIPDRTHPRTVRFEVVGGWRIDYPAGFETVLEYGDGQSNTPTEGFLLGTGFDASGLEYKFLKYVVTHTYPANGPDQYQASFTSCCRISNLLNANDATFLIKAKVDLSQGNSGNPRSLIPAIIQLQTGGVREHFIPAVDPDGNPVTCRFSTPTETGQSNVTHPPILGGAPPTLTPSVNPPGCKLTWNTTSGAATNQFAVQVQLESVNPLSQHVKSAVVDYIIELVQSPVPTCAITGTQPFILPIGVPFTTDLIGTNNAGGGSLKVTSIYNNGELLPLSGSTQASPFKSTFKWTPGPGEEGTALATIIYTDQKNQSGFCSLALTVPACPQYGKACTVGVGQCQAAGTAYCDAASNVKCTGVAGQPSPEICDNKDNNCDGEVDEGNPDVGSVCSTGLSGVCSTGIVSSCVAGAPQCIPDVVPGTLPETCNSLDDDCNGTVDDNYPVGEACSSGLGICKANGAYKCDSQGGLTCDAAVGTPTTEICDGVDNNCDGNVDENFGLGAACTIGQGACFASGFVVCNAMQNTVCNAAQIPPQSEICGNDVDEDCDGVLNTGCEDSDSDGLFDAVEKAIGTDPSDADSDDDGVPDGAEPSYDKDSDGDGLINALDPDSDNDGLFDGTELGLDCSNLGTSIKLGHCIPDADKGATKTDPLKADSDGSGAIDGSEDSNLNGHVDMGEGDPNLASDDKSIVDTDGDGLSDKLEDFLGLNLKDADSDDDGVLDRDEANFADDTDGDGLINALDRDSDNDGLFDGTEVGNTCQDPDTDVERDHCRADANHGVTKTCSLKADTDGGGVTDGSEDVNLNGMVDKGEADPSKSDDDINVKDTDGDGLSDGLEATIGSGLTDVDSDDDGLLDGDEPNPSDDQDEDGLLNVLDPDSDNDKLFDGTEAGEVCSNVHTNVSERHCISDVDLGATQTSPLNADTDRGATRDGDEDENHNGVVDPGERNPRDTMDDYRAPECTADADCGAASGKACEKQKCVLGCHSDVSCPDGQVCAVTAGKLGSCMMKEIPVPNDVEETGCSCSTVGGSGGALGWLVFATGAVFAKLRRRRDRRLPS